MNNGQSSVDRTFGDMKTTEDYLRAYFKSDRNDTNAQQWDRKKEELENEGRIRLSRMSPPESLGLPKLLDARRIEWLITDGAFSMAPLYNRVYVHQIPLPHEIEKKKGAIHVPDTVASKQLRVSQRGVLVSAGCLALDALRSNGVDLGHIVHFCHVNPFRLIVDFAEGRDFQLLQMTVDCISSSEDLADVLKSGAAKVQIVEGKHQITDAEGHLWDPIMPPGGEVY